MLTENMFIRVSQDCFKNANTKQAELYSSLDVIQLKIMFAMLAYANMINSVNRANQTEFSIPLKNFRKKGSLFKNIRLSKKELSEKVNEIKHPYFERIISSEKTINFNLKNKYLKDLNNSKSGYVEIKHLMGYKSISQIKMHMQLAYFVNYRIPLNFAINFLNISKKQSRKDQIRAIKNVFKSLKIENDCEYLFPKFREKKNELHYSFIVKTKKKYTEDVYF